LGKQKLVPVYGDLHPSCKFIDNKVVKQLSENIQLNNSPAIEILTGGAELLEFTAPFDIIFANINRNILLADMAAYTAKMVSGSLLFMSGFYESDLPVIREKAKSLGLKFVEFTTKNNWIAVRFEM